MSDLTKMFVLVPSTSSATVESIKTASTNSHKVYFMAKYNQIVAKGTVYGVDPSTGKELESLVSVLGGTKASDGTVTVDFSNLNYYTSEGTKTIIGAIEAIDAKVKAEMDNLAASKTLDENYEFTGQIKYVAAKDGVAAHIALVDEAGAELSTINVSDIIGNGVLKTSAYDAATGILTLTFAQADGTEKAIEVDLKAMLDINDIAIDSESSNYLGVKLGTADSNGEQQALFSAKIVKVAEASDTKTGLVDAKDVKDYVDGKTTDLAVTAEGDTYVSASVNANTDKKHVIVATNVKDVIYTAGEHATYNSDGTKATSGTAATISGVAKSLVDGEQATNAIKSYVDFVVAEEALRSDAKVLSSIKALDKASSTVDGTNVHVNYKEEDGIVTIESVTEDYAIVSRTPTVCFYELDYNKSSSISVDANDSNKLVNASDLIEVAYFVDDRLTEFAYYEYNRVHELTYNIDLKIDTKCENVTYYAIEQANYYTNNRIGSLNTQGLSYDDTQFIKFNYSQNNGLVIIGLIDTKYATLNTTYNVDTFDNGIATGDFVNYALENMWETYEG